MTKPACKICPYCQEEIIVTAVKCRYCREWLLSSKNPALEKFFGNLTGKDFGHYHVTDHIGDGGMGSVWLAKHIDLGHPVALKVLHGQLLSYQDVVKRFLAEARAVVRLGSPYLIEILDLGALPDGRPYFVMEYLNGTSLDVWMRTQKPVPFSSIFQVGEQLLQGLAVVHEHGIVHRDLKPSNIILLKTPENQKDIHLKLLDFGIAKYMVDTTEKDEPIEGAITRTGMTVGTPVYMSPEQAGGIKTIDGRSDLYAVGILLYQAITGQPPFMNNNILHIMEMHRWKAPAPLHTLRADVPPALENWVLRCLAKKRSQRFANAEEAKKALLLAQQQSQKLLSQINTTTKTHIHTKQKSTEQKPLTSFWLSLSKTSKWIAPLAIVFSVLLLATIFSSLTEQSPVKEKRFQEKHSPTFSQQFNNFSLQPEMTERSSSMSFIEEEALSPIHSSPTLTPISFSKPKKQMTRNRRAVPRTVRYSKGGPPGPEALIDPYRKK